MDEYFDLLNRTISDGMEAARNEYASKNQKDRLKGSLKGFEDCKGKNPVELSRLLRNVRTDVAKAFKDDADDYWFWRCRESEVEWVCNIIAAATGIPIEGSNITANGVMKANKLLKSKNCLSPREEEVFPD